MSWPRRRDGRLLRPDWQAETARLGEELGRAVQQHRRLETVTEGLRVQLARCQAERLRAQALAAAAEQAGQELGDQLQEAENRIRRAVVILADPHPDLETSQLVEEALRVLRGATDG